MENLVKLCLELMDLDQVEDIQAMIEEGTITPDVILDDNLPAQSLLLVAIVKRKTACVSMLMEHCPQLTILSALPGDSDSDSDYDYGYDHGGGGGGDGDDTPKPLPLRDIMTWAGMTDVITSKVHTDQSEVPASDFDRRSIALQLIYAKQGLALQCLLEMENFDEIDMQMLLYKAIKVIGCCTIIEVLLKHKVNIATYLPHPTHLVVAANLPDYDIFQLLLKYGASVQEHHMLDTYFRSVKHHWTYESDSDDDDLNTLFLSSDRFSQHSFPYCSTPLMCAINHNYQTAITRLIAAGADVNYQFSCTRNYSRIASGSYLHFALLRNTECTSVARNDEEIRTINNDTIHIIQALVGKGCDINYQDPRSLNQTALSVACWYRQDSIVQYMIQSYTSSNDASEIHGGNALINYYLTDATGDTVFSHIIKKCDSETVALLLSLDESLNCTIETVKSPFFDAIRNANNATDVCNLLIEKGYDVNVPGLLTELMHCHPEVLRLFLSHGIDPNVVDENGRSCIDNALSTASGRMSGSLAPDVVILLLLYGKHVTEFEFIKLLEADSTYVPMTRILLLELGRNYWNINFRDIKIDRLARFFAVLFGGCYNNPIFSDEEKRPICSEPFSLQHGARLAIRRQVFASIPRSAHDSRLSHALIRCFVELRLPRSMLEYVLFIKLEGNKCGSHDQSRPLFDVPLDLDWMSSNSSDILENYRQCLEKEVTWIYEGGCDETYRDIYTGNFS